MAKCSNVLSGAVSDKNASTSVQTSNISTPHDSNIPLPKTEDSCTSHDKNSTNDSEKLSAPSGKDTQGSLDPEGFCDPDVVKEHERFQAHDERTKGEQKWLTINDLGGIARNNRKFSFE